MAPPIEYEDFHLRDYSPPPGYKFRPPTPEGIAGIDGHSDWTTAESFDTTPTSPSPLRGVTTHSRNPSASYDSASSNAEFSNALFRVLILNIPFAIMLMLDMIGTFHPHSAFYRKNLYAKSSGGLAFHVFYLCLGTVTAGVDIGFVWTEVGRVVKSRAEDWPAWKLFVVVVSRAVGSLVAFSPVVFPFIAHTSHIEAPYDVIVMAECTESGYGSIIQLHIGEGGVGSNATFSTADGALGFTMKLSKTESGLDWFALDPTMPHNLTFAEVSVDFNLSAHTYESRLRDASQSENQPLLRRGLIFDYPYGRLSFPDLHWPLHTPNVFTWPPTYGKLREFELVDTADPQNTVLNIVAFDGECQLKVAACGMWSIVEVEEDWRKYESVAVSAGRILLEASKMSADCFGRLDRRWE